MMTLLKFIFSHKKLLITVIILILAGVFIGFKTGLIGKSSTVYKTQVVAKGNLSTLINASGQVKSENQSTISFLTSGRVGYIGFKKGDTVKKGQIIASLDTTQAREALSKAEAVYKSASSSITKVLDDIHLSQYGNGGFDNIGSKNETMTQKNTREAAEMVRDGAYQDLQSARKNLEWATIIAPFDGVISDISNMQVGQNVTAATGVNLTVVGTEKYKFVADVDEIEFKSLSACQSGEIVLDAYPENKFTGQILYIGVAATKLATGGSVIPVELSLSGSEKLIAGLNGEVNFTVVAKENVLVLPKTAVRKNDSTDFVYVLQNSNPVKKNVTTGESVGNQVEITSGLTEGEKIILGDVKQ